MREKIKREKIKKITVSTIPKKKEDLSEVLYH